MGGDFLCRLLSSGRRSHFNLKRTERPFLILVCDWVGRVVISCKVKSPGIPEIVHDQGSVNWLRRGSLGSSSVLGANIRELHRALQVELGETYLDA